MATKAKLDSTEIDLQITQLLQWRKELNNNSAPFIKNKYLELEKELIDKLLVLVNRRCARYRRFDNHPDLIQDGLEALCLSLETYDPSKGSFIWWANKYIGTRVARAANQHSAIRIPIAKAGVMKPIRTSKLPLIYDPDLQADEQIDLIEFNCALNKCLSKMSERQRALAQLLFQKEMTREEAILQLELNRRQFGRLYKSITSRLRRELALWSIDNI